LLGEIIKLKQWLKISSKTGCSQGYCTQNFGGETSRKVTFRRPGQVREDNIKVDRKDDGIMWTVFIRLVVDGKGLP